MKRLFSLILFAVALAFAGTALVPETASATALTAARYTQCKNNGAVKRFLMKASTTIYRGGLVMVNSSGTAEPAAASASNNGVVGVATESKTSAASGNYWINTREAWCKFAGTTLGQDDVGVIVYAEDDQTVDETVGTNEPVAGLLVEYISASEAWIHVSPVYQGRTNSITDPVTLTQALTLSEGATLGQATDNEVEFTENSEDFSFVFGTNAIAMSSDTGVVEWDFAAVGTTIKLANDQTIVSDTDGEIQFADGSEDVSMGFATSNTVVWTSDTGVVVFDLAAVGTTIQLANDQQIISDTDNEIQFGDNSEDISFGFGTANECTVTTDTGVTRVDFGDIGVKSSVPLFILDSQHFCGQGANGSTATYIGPVLKSAAADETTYVFGAAGCDGLDNTTEATADAPLDRAGDIEVHGMSCAITDGGTDDSYAFQLRDDTADVTGVTCSITLDGSGTDVCSVILDAPVTVAHGSTMAVKQVGTDDDCSACDTECWVYFSY